MQFLDLIKTWKNFILYVIRLNCIWLVNLLCVITHDELFQLLYMNLRFVVISENLSDVSSAIRLGKSEPAIDCISNKN